MVTIHSDMTQERSRKFSPVSFIASPLTLPIRASCTGNDLIERGLSSDICGRVRLYPCCVSGRFYGFNLSSVNSRKETCCKREK